MSRCRLTIARASVRPDGVRAMGPYFRWSARPRSTSFATIPVTEELATDRRAARCVAVMAVSCHSVKA